MRPNIGLVFQTSPPAAPAQDPFQDVLNSSSLMDLLAGALVIGLALVEAAVILLVGWLIARFVRSIITRVLRKTRIENRLGRLLNVGRGGSMAITAGMGNFVYGLMMMFVFIEVLQALGLTMVSAPLNDLVGTVLGFIPRLLAAATLGGAAWCLASLARLMSRNVIGTFDVERRLGQSEEQVGRGDITRTLSDAVYYSVFLFFLPQMLDALQMEGLSPVQEMVGELLGSVPNFLGAIIVFVVFYFVAKTVQRLTVPMLSSLGFDRVPGLIGMENVVERPASVLAGKAVLVSMLFVGAVQAANMLGLIFLAEMAQGLMIGLFQIFLAMIIFSLGLYVSGVVHRTLSVWEKSSESDAPTPLAASARVAILCFAGAMALGQTGLASEIIQLAFGALVCGVALAGGLAFGFGGKESAARWIESRSSDEASPARAVKGESGGI